tara:strand:+ start:660 stop:866 length:207 start_codon:yes stop_codon:yes gene_type:complete
MNKNDETLKRRRFDLIQAIEKSPKNTGLVISNFAAKHYLSESTVWKDYERALDEQNDPRSNGRGSKHH